MVSFDFTDEPVGHIVPMLLGICCLYFIRTTRTHDYTQGHTRNDFLVGFGDVIGSATITSGSSVLAAATFLRMCRR